MVEKLDEIKCEDPVEKMIVLRKRSGLYQYDFAKEIGVTPGYLRKIENYEMPFSDKLKKRVNAFIKKHFKEV